MYRGQESGLIEDKTGPKLWPSEANRQARVRQRVIYRTTVFASYDKTEY